MKQSLSIVVPVLNEKQAVTYFASAVGPVLNRVRKKLGAGAWTEVVFVDDGSKDGTAEALLSLEIPGSTVRIVKLSRNFGKESALTAGLQQAKGGAVVPMDVDLQDPVALLEPMVDVWVQGAKVVNAVRRRRDNDSWLKQFSAKNFYRIYNRITREPMEPNVGDFRLLDRQVVDILNAMPERVRFMKGLFNWIGFDPVNVTYDRPERVAGSTKFRYWTLWNFALDGLTGASTLPIRIWSYVGSLLTFAAFLYATYIFLSVMIFGTDQPGYASTIIIILIMFGFNFIALGILGEYIGRIFIETKGRPIFVVEYVKTNEEPSEIRKDLLKLNSEIEEESSIIDTEKAVK